MHALGGALPQEGGAGFLLAQQSGWLHNDNFLAEKDTPTFLYMGQSAISVPVPGFYCRYVLYIGAPQSDDLSCALFAVEYLKTVTVEYFHN